MRRTAAPARILFVNSLRAAFMDRQAWIAVTLCVVGFVALQVYNAKHLPPPPVPAAVSPTPAAAPENPAAPLLRRRRRLVLRPGRLPTPSPAASIAPFAEKTETLRNDDVELHLTNRGAGITRSGAAQAYVGESGQPVVLNSPEHTPIGAIIEQPATPALPEFTIVRGR